MKKIQLIRYQCDICGEVYDSKKEAQECESQPVTEDKGVQVGDIIVILTGDGAGSDGEVERTYIINRTWGHYMWKRYWHTVGVQAKVLNSWGSRALTFDDYKLKTEENERV